MGSAPSGGAILQVAGEAAGAVWAASPAGLFHTVDGRWSGVQGGMPLAQFGAVLARRRYVLAAGLAGGAVFSLDGGASWQHSRIEQTAAPLSCIAASPNFWQDGVLLAGTQGDGMLRSTDSGRSWQLVNFGLRSFDIFALATAPAWGRKELAFAGTADGVYLSPNGGRAWKPCGLSQRAILALATSPNFDQDHTLLAGAEDGVYRSQDGGTSWTAIDLGLLDPPMINALWFSQDGQTWMGTSEHGVWRSGDGGAGWVVLENSPSSVLCLGGWAELIYAGTFDQGLYISADGGASWQPETGLSARRFQWFRALAEPLDVPQVVEAPAFLAGGALEGVWLATNGGGDWQPLPRKEDAELPLCLAVDAAGVWVGGSSGVWKTARLAEPLTLSLQTGEAMIALASAGGLLWAGSMGGSLWVTDDGGGRWQAAEFPGQGRALLALAAAGQEVLAAVRDARRKLVRIWRGKSVTGQVTDLKWELWLEENTSWEVVQLAHGGPGLGHWVAILGTRIYMSAPDGLRSCELPSTHTPPQALAWSEPAQAWLAAAGDELWASGDLKAWRSVETNLPVADVVAFQNIQTVAPSLAALTVDGSIWQWRQ